MPIPFLLIGIGAGAAALGVGKTIKAGVDQKNANEVNERAQDIVKKATNSVNRSRQNSGDALANLGKKKVWILDNSMKPFISSFEKLHNVDLTDSVGLDEMRKFRIDEQSFSELKEMRAIASSLLGGAASGATLGAITAFGAYGGVSLLGTAATTGTAIASLSGVAATNATLAFLGGGALSVGGLGIAGGTAVLGGLIAGPALAIMGFVVGAKASANRDEAYSNLSKAKEYREEMEMAKSLCKGIRMRADMFKRLMVQLNAVFEPRIDALEQIIESSGTDYALYTAEQKNTVAASMAIAGAIKAMLDTPILTDDGKLTIESEEIAYSVQGTFQAVQA